MKTCLKPEEHKRLFRSPKEKKGLRFRETPVFFQQAEEADFVYIQEKLKNYILDADNAKWQDFFVAKNAGKTVGFGRIINHGGFFEIASLGVDYYYRKKGIGKRLLLFLVSEAKRLDSKKPVYSVTHIPVFFRKAGFEAVSSGPPALEKKKKEKCKLRPEQSRIMIFAQ